MRMLVLLFLVFYSLVSVSAKSECVDGVHNVVHLKDELKGKGAIRFHDVSFRTYDLRKRPRCAGGKPSFKFPGHIKFYSGEIEIFRGLHNSESPLKLQLSLEKNSWLVGTVCDNGVSKNQYVPNEVCTLEICKLMGDQCKIFERAQVLTIQDLPPVMHDFIDIGPMAIPQVAGEWALSFRLEQAGKVVAHLSVTPPREWLNVESDNEEKPSKAEMEEIERRLKEGKNEASEDAQHRADDEL